MEHNFKFLYPPIVANIPNIIVPIPQIAGNNDKYLNDLGTVSNETFLRTENSRFNNLHKITNNTKLRIPK